jgi:hypothetical protein
MGVFLAMQAKTRKKTKISETASVYRRTAAKLMLFYVHEPKMGEEGELQH